MNILLITFDFFPKKGGVAHTLMCLWKYFQSEDHNLFIIDPYTKDKNIYDILDKTPPKFKDLANFFKTENIKLILKTFLTIIRDGNIKFLHKINLILYFLTKPKFLINTIKNVKNM